MLGKFITKHWLKIAIFVCVLNSITTIISWVSGLWIAVPSAFVTGLLLASLIDYKTIQGLKNILHKSMALNDSMWNELRTICKLAGVDQKLNVPKEFFNGSEKN